MRGYDPSAARGARRVRPERTRSTSATTIGGERGIRGRRGAECHLRRDTRGVGGSQPGGPVERHVRRRRAAPHHRSPDHRRTGSPDHCDPVMPPHLPGGKTGPAGHRNPTTRRPSVSTEQRETVDAILRQSALPVGSSVEEQRRLFREAVSAQPLPADVTVTAGALGGVQTAEITIDGIEPRHVVLYFHGGVYVISDAFLAAGLASQIARRTQAKVISVDYRLAPDTRIRRRSTTPLRRMKPSCTTVSPRRTSPSRETPPAPGSRSPPWSTPAITGSLCPPRRS